MAGGSTLDGVIQERIDDAVAKAALSARASMPTGENERSCAIRDDVPESRRRAAPGARTRVARRSGREQPSVSAVHRRGSQDNQPR